MVRCPHQHGSDAAYEHVHATLGKRAARGCTSRVGVRLTSDDDISAELVNHAAEVCAAWAWPRGAEAYAALYADR